MAKKKNPHAFISTVEADTAVYIDFEGFQDSSPALLGVLIGDKIEQVVFDKKLESAAIAKNLRVADLSNEIQRLIDLCHQESRFIVAFSQHELRVIKEYTNNDISEIYRDARMIAKKWKRKFHPDNDVVCKGLKDYLAFIGYQRGSYLGERKSTSRIRAVRDMCSSRGEYNLLTPVVKAKWTKLLEHNEIDCKGMRELVQKAAHVAVQH